MLAHVLRRGIGVPPAAPDAPVHAGAYERRARVVGDAVLAEEMRRTQRVPSGQEIPAVEFGVVVQEDLSGFIKYCINTGGFVLNFFLGGGIFRST